MFRLGIIVLACVLLAAGTVAVFSDWNWQGAVFSIAVGVALLIYYLRG